MFSFEEKPNLSDHLSTKTGHLHNYSKAIISSSFHYQIAGAKIVEAPRALPAHH